MSDVLLETRLKVADPTALTALATLRDRLRLAPALEGLSREEYTLFEVDLDPAAARDLVSDLCRKTNLFLNPNKHAWRVRIEGVEPGAPPAADGGARPAPGREPAPEGASAWLLVHVPGDGEERLDSVHRHVGAPAVRRVATGTLWRATGAPGVAAERVVEALRAAAVVENRHAGFLVHPAFQVGHLYAARPSVYDVREALFGATGVAVSGD
jgi:phosphoribosylformylglycinamidine (FGAM) synthase PurS component